MSSGLASSHSHHSENLPAYHNNPLGSIPFDRYLTRTTTEPPSTKISIQKRYIFSIHGLARILLILCLLGGWIAAAVVVRDGTLANNPDYGGYTSTRIAYLVFAIGAFIVYNIYFILEVLNIFNAIKFLRKIPMQLIVSFYFIMKEVFLFLNFNLLITWL